MFQSETIVVERDTDGSAVLKLDVPGRSLNVLTRQVLLDLDNAFDVIGTHRQLPVLVVRSGKKSGFLAGADLAEFRTIADEQTARALSERGQKLFDKLARLAMPSVAVVHGPCLGGGLELALACDYRLVFDRPDTQLGLPEVELGLLPGWGGTQRLPRVVGLERALQMILTGRRLTAREALDWGLADALGTDEASFRDQYARLLFRAVAQGKRKVAGLPLRTWRQRLLESNLLGRRLLFQGSERRLRQRVPEDMPAPAEALAAVRLGIQRGLEAGLAREREAAGRLAVSSACRNLIELFFERESARKLPAALAGIPSVQRLGVIGAGVMGAGIAQLAALKGIEVVVQEVNPDALTAGLKRIDDLFARAVARGKLDSAEMSRRRAAIRGTVAWEGFEKVDLVIEAAVEDLAVKRNLFREVLSQVPRQAVVASNTSSLCISALQQGASRPGRIAGLHFFNPVHKLPLVEVVVTPNTDTDVAGVLTRFVIDLGKTPAQVGDGPGFVVNRVLMVYLDEAMRLVGEGLAIADIDGLMRRFGMPVGPLELLDQIGLDVALRVAQVLDRPSPLEPLVKRGWLGQKSGLGFYIHQGKARPHVESQKLLRQGTPNELSQLPEAARLAEARERLVLPMVNEAVAVVAAGLAEPLIVDLAMVLGAGWAPHRGGPLRYADQRGLADVTAALDRLANRLGPRFAPCPELRRRAEQGQSLRGSPER